MPRTVQRGWLVVDGSGVTTWRSFFSEQLPPARGVLIPRVLMSDVLTLELIGLVDRVCYPPHGCSRADLAADVVQELRAIRDSQPVGYAWARREILRMFPSDRPGMIDSHSSPHRDGKPGRVASLAVLETSAVTRLESDARIDPDATSVLGSREF